MHLKYSTLLPAVLLFIALALLLVPINGQNDNGSTGSKSVGTPPVTPAPAATRIDVPSPSPVPTPEVLKSNWADDTAKILTSMTYPLTAVIIFGFIFLVGYIYRELLNRLLDRISHNAKTVNIPHIARVDISEEAAPASTQSSELVELPQAPTSSEIKGESELLSKTEGGSTEASGLFEQFIHFYSEPGDILELERIYTELQENENDETKKVGNRLLYLQLRFRHGDSKALEELETLTSEKEFGSRASRTLGYIKLRNNSLREARKHFEDSLKAETLEIRRIESAKGLATVSRREGDLDTFDFPLLQLLTEIENPDSLFSIYTELASEYEAAEKSELRVLALEKASEIQPSNTDILFKLGFAYGLKEKHELSLISYENLLNFDPKNEWGLNNRGVQYDRLQLPIHSSESYHLAITEGNTLASANLAKRYLNAGFEVPAREILENAQKQPIVHENVGTTLAELKEKRDDENKRIDGIHERALRQQSFMREYAGNYFIPVNVIPRLDGKWTFNEEGASDDFSVEIEQNASEIHFDLEELMIEYRIKGKIRNRAIEVERFTMGWTKDFTERTYTKDVDGFGYISEETVFILFPSDSKERSTFGIERLFPNVIRLVKKHADPNKVGNSVQS